LFVGNHYLNIHYSCQIFRKNKLEKPLKPWPVKIESSDETKTTIKAKKKEKN